MRQKTGLFPNRSSVSQRRAEVTRLVGFSRAACSTVAAVAPVFGSTSAKEAGPREFANNLVPERREVSRESAANVARTYDSNIHIFWPL
jgi:hypothetical protein